jgi:uncharacterized protein (TIGR02611 family)
MDSFKEATKLLKRIAIGVAGLTVLVIGIVMIVAPGPALIMIPAGLAILGLEFAWARLLLRRLRQKISARNSAGQGSRAEAHRERHAP